MAKKRKHYGFSLTEVLLAMATLSIGMIFVAGVFPVAIHFSTVATERTFGAVVADEAFAKIRLYNQFNRTWVLALPASPPGGCVDFNDVSLVDVSLAQLNCNEFAYPSYDYADISRTRYTWSALCRRMGNTRLVQVTVFVCRRTSAAQSYWNWDPVGGLTDDADHPVPVRLDVLPGSNRDELEIDEAPGEETLINDGYIIVDDATGRLYRVRQRLRGPDNRTIVFDMPWEGGSWVWVVPPPPPLFGGGRYPCIAVYQKVIAF